MDEQWNMPHSQAAEQKPTNWLKIFGIGCGGAFLVCVLCCGGVLVYFALGPEGGVRTTNTMERYALDYLNQQALLEPGENIVAYYDVTISLDSSEAAILTDQRLIYHAPLGDTVFDLAEIDSIDHRYESLMGDIITVAAKDGRVMGIEIAPMNSGSVFLNALIAQAKQHCYQP